MPDLDLHDDDQTVAIALLQDLDRLTGNACVGCARPVCGHEALFSIALGFKNAPRCLTCLANGLQSKPEELWDQFTEFLQHRDCYRQAWKAACDREIRLGSQQPCCRWSALKSAAAVSPLGSEQSLQSGPAPLEAVADHWNAGEMACGDLVFALRVRLNALPPGAVLKVTALDAAAPLDLPAWCRLTGNPLLHGEHPDYFIRRKDN